MSDTNAERKGARTSSDAPPLSADCEVASARDSNVHRVGLINQGSISLAGTGSTGNPLLTNAPPNGLPLSVTGYAPAVPSGHQTSNSLMNPAAAHISPWLADYRYHLNLNEHLQRQQLFAHLTSTSNLATGTGTATPPDVFLSLMLSQQQNQPLSETQNALMERYMYMNTMNRMLQLQRLQQSMVPYGSVTSHFPQASNNVVMPQQQWNVSGPPQLSVVQQAMIGQVGLEALSAVPVSCPVLHERSAPPKSLARSGADRVEATALGDGVPHALPVLLSRPTDNVKLSRLQALLRQQIQVFQATDVDIVTHVRGRNKAIKLSQVGIRCRHCAHKPAVNRYKGSAYFPTSVWGVYQASQNMCNMHLQEGSCQDMPLAVKEEFLTLLNTKKAANSTSGAGRSYWAETAQELGLVDAHDGIFFVRNLPTDVRFPTKDSDEPGVYRKCGKRKDNTAQEERPAAG